MSLLTPPRHCCTPVFHPFFVVFGPGGNLLLEGGQGCGAGPPPEPLQLPVPGDPLPPQAGGEVRARAF